MTDRQIIIKKCVDCVYYRVGQTIIKLFGMKTDKAGGPYCCKNGKLFLSKP